MHMKFLRSLLNKSLWVVGVCGVGLALAGCKSSSGQEPVFSDAPPVAGDVTPVAAPTTIPPSASAASESPVLKAMVASGSRFRTGDLVTITFSGTETVMPVHEERIKDDGTVTLHLVGSILAQGKTPGELQKEIHDAYVPRFYTRLVVTVKPLEQVYYVGGEVRQPGRQSWMGEIRVTQAVQSAGYFTDFADKKRVLLVRADGSQTVVNCLKAMNNSKLDPIVMPGDTITVKRRWW